MSERINKSPARSGSMNEGKKITMWIEWSDEDDVFIGYCPQFFPYGAVCHAHMEAKAVAKLEVLPSRFPADVIAEDPAASVKRARAKVRLQ